MEEFEGWVKVELMTMDSRPGYVPSWGFQEAILVEKEQAASCGNDPEALWGLAGEQINEGLLSDLEVRSERSGALNYRWTSGIFAVPEGHVVVQRIEESICTHNNGCLERNAWIVNESSLLALYEERAEAYRKLADAAAKLVSKEIGFKEFKATVRGL